MIRGRFSPLYPNIPWVLGVIEIPELSTGPSAIPFMIDTGAGVTCLHPVNAINQVGIAGSVLTNPPQAWPPAQDHGGIGGSMLYHHFRCTFRFHHIDGRWQAFDDVIAVAQLVSGTNDMLPSLLGWNVRSRFTLEITQSRGEVFLR